MGTIHWGRFLGRKKKARDDSSLGATNAEDEIGEEQTAEGEVVEDPMETTPQPSEGTGTPLSSTAYIQEVIEEVQQIVENTRARTLRAAEAAAEEKVDQAKEKAQAIIAEARSQAAEAASLEVQTIIDDARAKADLMEAEASLKIQFMLMEARDRGEAEIKDEAAAAYRRMMVGVQNLMEEAQKVKSEWRLRSNDFKQGMIAKGKTAEQNKTPSPTPAQEPASVPVREVESPTQEDGEDPSSSFASQDAETPPSDERRTSSEQEANSRLQVRSSEGTTEPVEGPDPGNNPSQPKSKKETRKTSKKPRETSNAAIQEAGGEHELPSTDGGKKRSGMGGTTEQQDKGRKTQATPSSQDPIEETSEVENSMAYTGEVELIFPSPVDASIVAQVCNSLEANPELKIVRTVGSWEQGNFITVSLERPLPLIGILSEMAAIKVKPMRESPTSLGSLMPSKGDSGRTTARIEISTNESLDS